MSTMDKAVVNVLNEVGLDGEKVNDFLHKRFEAECREAELNREEEEMWEVCAPCLTCPNRFCKKDGCDRW